MQVRSDHRALRDRSPVGVQPPSSVARRPAGLGRARAPFRGDLEARALLEELAAPGHEETVFAEGQLIQAYLNRHGELPPWNKIGGSSVGGGMATANTEPMLDLLR